MPNPGPKKTFAGELNVYVSLHVAVAAAMNCWCRNCGRSSHDMLKPVDVRTGKGERGASNLLLRSVGRKRKITITGSYVCEGRRYCGIRANEKSVLYKAKID